MTDLQTAQIVITRTLTEDGHDEVEVVDHTSSLVEALGLLRFAEDTIVRERMEPEDDE